MVTSFGEARRVHAALEAGATGYMLKDADAQEIVHAIRAAHRGEVHLDGTTTGVLTRALIAPRRGIPTLTTRGREVLVLVAQGLSNRDIGRAMSIGERTMQTHRGNLLARLELTSRTQAALWANREGPVGNVSCRCSCLSTTTQAEFVTGDPPPARSAFALPIPSVVMVAGTAWTRGNRRGA